MKIFLDSDSSARDEYQLPSKAEEEEKDKSEETETSDKEGSEKEGELEVTNEEDFKMVNIAKDGKYQTLNVSGGKDLMSVFTS